MDPKIRASALGLSVFYEWQKKSVATVSRSDFCWRWWSLSSTKIVLCNTTVAAKDVHVLCCAITSTEDAFTRMRWSVKMLFCESISSMLCSGSAHIF
jgi:hypothetical protein